ncbi:MAG TPA: DUF4097 family beta strand repeat-containing protein [Bryobacteraceae bacterium]|nr:DUF4097 family beta strand repeat-containing protein [Bryobacteraceae bacterium]
MKKFALLLVCAFGLSAQLRDNTDKQMNCDNNRGNDRPRSCKITEQTVASVGRLTIDAGHNGGVSVRGWSKGQTLVRAKVEAWAPTDSEASLIAGQIHVDAAGGNLRATGPDLNNDRGWAVSWEVFTPHATDVKAAAHNGGVHVSDIRGRLEMTTHNGGVHLARVAGDVTGTTHNGGIHVEIATVESGQLNFNTHNGGIHLTLPNSYSARVHAETNNGGIHSDFPIPELERRDRDRERRPRNVDFTIGSGGPSINVKTHNGGVHIGRG